MKTLDPEVMRQAEAEINRRIASRSCGTCTACCTTQGVQELQKDPGEPCKHALPGVGCAIYARRPPSCAEWHCAWRMGEFSRNDRPDQVGVVMDLSEYAADAFPDGFAYVARPAFNGGIEKASKFLSIVAARSIVVVLHSDGRRQVMGPPQYSNFIKTVTFVSMDRPVRRLPMYGLDPGGQEDKP